MTLKHTLHLLFLLRFLFEGVSLPSPENVTIDSVNLRSVLRWSPVQTPHHEAVKYKVQYRLDGIDKWLDVPSCSPTNETHCNFWHTLRSYINVTLRIQAQAGDQTSAWYQSKPFMGRAQTQLNHPNVTVSPEVPLSLRVQVQPDENLQREYGDDLRYRIFYGKETEELKFYGDYRHTTIIKPLEAEMKYCVQVLYVIYPDKRLGNSPSTLQCAIIKQSEKDRLLRILLVSVSAVIISGAFMMGCFWLVYKHCHKSKNLLDWPDLQITDPFEEHPITHQPQINGTYDSYLKETYDKISLITEDDMLQERKTSFGHS